MVVKRSRGKLRLLLLAVVVAGLAGIALAATGALWGLALLVAAALIALLYLRPSWNEPLMTLDDRGVVREPDGETIAWEDVDRVRFGWANYHYYYEPDLVITSKAAGAATGTEGLDPDEFRVNLLMADRPGEIAENVARRAGKSLDRCSFGEL